MRYFRNLCVLCALLAIGSARLATAQDDPGQMLGPVPFASYHGGDIDTIDLWNGGLNVDIPLISYPQRGGKLKLEFVLHYFNTGSQASEMCDDGGFCSYQGNGPMDHGFYVLEKHLLTVAAYATNYNYNYNPPLISALGASLGEPMGVTHPMVLTSSSTSGATFESIDATGFQVKGIGSLSNTTCNGYTYPMYQGGVFGIDPDGTRYSTPVCGAGLGNSWSDIQPFPCSFYANLICSREDSNGNEITSSGSGWTDTMSRLITAPVHVPYYQTTSPYFANAPFPPSGATTDFSYCSGPDPIATAWIWSPPGPNGGTYPIKFCYVEMTEINPVGDPLSGGPFSYTGIELQSVVLPDHSTWTFLYTADANGYNFDLTQVIFPTGGTLSYTWYPPDMWDRLDYRQVASRTLNPNDGVTPAGTWSYTGYTDNAVDPTNCPVCQTIISSPPSSGSIPDDTVHTFTQVGCCVRHVETETQYYQGSHTNGTLLKTRNMSYTFTTQVFDNYYLTNQSINLVPTQTTTTWANGQQTKTTPVYDSALTYYCGAVTSSFTPVVNLTGLGNCIFTSGSYGRVPTQYEYDYGSGAPGSLLRTTTTAYQFQSNANYLTNNLLNLPASVQVTDGGGTTRAYTTYAYDATTPVGSGISIQHDLSPPAGTYRGNLTSVSRWLNTTGGYLTNNNTYFDTGTVDVATDPKTNPTTYAYSSTYYGAYPTTVTNALSQSTTFAYDFNTGFPTSVTDPNGQTTGTSYDNMLRTTQITYPATPTGTGQTNFSYPTATTVQISQKIDSGHNRTSNLLVDGLGHEIQSNTTNGETTPYDQTDTCYNALGQVSYKSYPYQSTGLSTPSCSGSGDSFAYDALGRTTSVTHSDSSSVLTSYTGRATSVQDEGNGTQRVQRISQVDGLGHLASMCEVTSTTLSVGISGSTAPSSCGLDISGTGFLTSYAYDALDNLTGVTQGPLNSRTFVYDSLSRLTSATNPESGGISYAYDADGNVTYKTDARSATIGYTYDNLNRVVHKIYSDSTPSMYFAYDETSQNGITLSNPIGRLTFEGTNDGTNWLAESVFSYDPMGRVLNNSQCTPQNCPIGSMFWLAYTYDLLGDITSSTNGAGVTLTNSYNTGARLLSVTSSFSDSSHPAALFGYSTGAHYNAAGSLLSTSLGYTFSSESRTYDGRLRLTGITDGSSVYSVAIPTSGGYAPNSNVLSGNDNVNGNWTYSYDPFNRLTVSNLNSSTVIYGYSYDRFGNRWLEHATTGTGAYSSLGFDANNRIVSGFGVSYDAAGNVTNDGSTAYTYDAEDRITTAVNSSSGTSTYVYDASGRRVRKTTGGSSVDFLYDLSGHEISQITSAGSWTRGEVYAGGRHLATYTGGVGGSTSFIYADWLGTERARATYSSGPTETCTSLPFGDWLTCTGADPSPMHFTGKERDAESGLDNFGARYDSSSLGRFMTPDWSAKVEPVPYSKLDNPQSLNLYSYVLNNPLSNVDTDGHACSGVLGNTGSGFCTRATEYGRIDAISGIQSQTRFFAAANAVSQALADVDAPGSSLIGGISGKTASFLEGVGQNLEKLNQTEASAIQNGTLGGPNLDQQLVHNEQSAVQSQLDSLQQSNPDAYKTTISEINGALNPGAVGQFASTRFSTDKAYASVLAGVRKDLGRNIDFSKQSDREAVGNALINHVRQTGGCDVNGTRQPGC